MTISAIAESQSKTHIMGTDEHDDFRPLLKSMGFMFIESKHYLIVGSTGSFEKIWILSLSIITKQVEELINRILPILKDYECAFRVPLNKYATRMINGGGVDVSEFNKAVVIYLVSPESTGKLLSRLLEVTNDLYGAAIEGNLRINKVLHISFLEQQISPVNEGKLVYKHINPKRKQIPFPLPLKVKESKYLKWINRRFLIVQQLFSTIKGGIYKCIDVGHFRFSWAIVKVGKAYSADDEWGRDTVDRMKWQKAVILDLELAIKTARFLDLHIDKNGNSYLCIEYLEGTNLRLFIERIISKREWRDLPSEVKVSILTKYVEILQIVAKIHYKGYVHRDIMPDNFILTANNEVAIIDFELAFNYRTSEPNPPFVLGSKGYMSPEQAALKMPTIKADIYSLGSVLFFFLTGKHPLSIISDDSLETEAALKGEFNNDASMIIYIDVILKCWEADPASRASIIDIDYQIKSIINSLNHEK